ncbi:MAG TPA: phage tail tip lysozyme [Candidatus Saccharimonadia bacterium]|nr:phage tail tip lysozyme [Candidatus Saccharimonadia bacterium]
MKRVANLIRPRYFLALGAVLIQLLAVFIPAPVAAELDDLRAIRTNYPFYLKGDQLSCGTGTTTADAATGENEQDVWNYLNAPGRLQPYQAAGVMGNMQAESHFDPTLIEGGGNSPDPNAAGSGGYGLVQWTPGSKLARLLNGKPSTVLNEMDALWGELTTGSEKAAGKAVMDSTTLDQARLAFEIGYERHSGPPQPIRLQFATEILAKYGNGAPSSGTPGSAGGPVSTEGCSSGAVTTTGGCTNPFAAGKFQLGRTDDGVDYEVDTPQPLLAVCDMVFLATDATEGWGPGSSFFYAKLTSGPFAGKCWYYAEHLSRSDLPEVGKQYKAGDHIGTLNPGGWQLEVGFAKANHLAATSVGNGNYPSVSGIAAAKFLRSLGAQTQQDPGPGGAVYGGGSCQDGSTPPKGAN